MNIESRDTLKKFLDDFIHAEELNLEPTEEQIELYKTSLVVNEHIDNNTSPEQFKFIIEEKQLQNELTPVLISDFNHGDEIKLIVEVEKLDGVYKTKMLAPNPIRNTLDKEDNLLYAVFSCPIKAFSFIKNMNNLFVI